MWLFGLILRCPLCYDDGMMVMSDDDKFTNDKSNAFNTFKQYLAVIIAPPLRIFHSSSGSSSSRNAFTMARHQKQPACTACDARVNTWLTKTWSSRPKTKPRIICENKVTGLLWVCKEGWQKDPVAYHCNKCGKPKCTNHLYPICGDCLWTYVTLRGRIVFVFWCTA